MKTRTIVAKYGHGTDTNVFVYDQRDGSAWYVIEDSANVNLAPDGEALKDGVNVEEIEDMDTSTAAEGISSEEELVAFVDDEPTEEEGPTDEQQEEYDRLKDAAEAQLDEIATQYEEHTTRADQNNTDQRLRLNSAAEAFSRSEIEEAEMRDRITEEQAEELRDEVHAMAADRHPK